MSQPGLSPIQSEVTTTVSEACVIAVIVIAGWAVGACGSSGSSSTSSQIPTPSPSPKQTVVANFDPCTLVTAVDASAVIGTTVTNTAAAGGVSVPGACSYATSDLKSFVLVFAQAFPDATTADAVSPEQLAASLSAYLRIANPKAVNGIGDKAVEYNLTSSGGEGILIIVFKANVIFTIAISPSDPSTVERLATTAAGKVH